MALAIFYRCTNLSHVKQLHAHLLAAGYLRSSADTTTKLLELCAAVNISYASRLLVSLPAASTNHWNALIRGLALSPDPAAAVTWFRRMLREHRRFDALTCSFSLKACARAMALPEAAQLHAQVARSGFGADFLLMTTLLDAYSKVGDLARARNVFDEMPNRDAASWNALIAGLAHGNLPGEALRLFRRMREETGLRPDAVTVLGALSACSQLGAVRRGEEVHAYAIIDGLDRNAAVSNAVIDMYAKCGLVEKAHAAFLAVSPDKKCLVTWNTMIMAWATHGEARRALDLFREMVGTGLLPDEVSHLGALQACNHAGLVDEGLRLFGLIESPNVKHYGSVIDLLGRAGRLREAYEMVSSAGTEEEEAVLWQTLLGACATYKDVGMAEAAAARLAQMGSLACGDFVLLSNVYAAHGRWADVGRVRESMRRREVRKVPGFSYA